MVAKYLGVARLIDDSCANLKSLISHTLFMAPTSTAGEASAHHYHHRPNYALILSFTRLTLFASDTAAEVFLCLYRPPLTCTRRSSLKISEMFYIMTSLIFWITRIEGKEIQKLCLLGARLVISYILHHTIG